MNAAERLTSTMEEKRSADEIFDVPTVLCDRKQNNKAH